MDHSIVIIVTYNGILWIEKCLDSVFGSTVIPVVLVIDNASTDQTVSVVEKFPKAVLIRNEKNIGFGQANNLGLKYAMDHEYEFVFLLNQDTTIDPDMFKKMIEIHKENRAYGILSPLHFNGKGTQIDHNFYSYLISGCPGYIQALLTGQTLNPVYPIHFANAAFWLISRRCIKEVGGFDPVFFHRGEDGDYINRASYKGFKTGLCPEAIGYHDREDRPQPSTYGEFQAIKQIIVLKNLKNPFNGLKPVFRSTLRQYFRECLNNLFRLRFIMAVFYWELAVFSIRSYKKIKISREIEKNEFSHLQCNENSPSRSAFTRPEAMPQAGNDAVFFKKP